MQHQIRADTRTTRFCDKAHLVIVIDGVPLDELLADATGNEEFLGLIPAWLDVVDDARERKVVWDRIRRAATETTVVPVLVCPDDLDLWCTVIVADTTYGPDTVTWHALGINAGGSIGLPESIGSEVNWLNGLGPFQFTRSDYDACVARFWEVAT